MAQALASLARGLFPGSWRHRVREQFGLDSPQVPLSEIPIPPEIAAKDEYDEEMYRYSMRQDSRYRSHAAWELSRHLFSMCSESLYWAASFVFSVFYNCAVS